MRQHAGAAARAAVRAGGRGPLPLDALDAGTALDEDAWTAGQAAELRAPLGMQCDQTA